MADLLFNVSLFTEMVREQNSTCLLFCKDVFRPDNANTIISKLLSGRPKDEALEIIHNITRGHASWTDFWWHFLNLFEVSRVPLRKFIETVPCFPRTRRLLLEMLAIYEAADKFEIDENIGSDLKPETIVDSPEPWRATTFLAGLNIDNPALEHQLLKLENDTSLFRILPKNEWPFFLIHLDAEGIEPLLITQALIKANLIE